MRRWLPAVAVGCLLALAALLLLGPRVAATDAERVDALAHELRCPDCAGLSVADSPTTSAREMRRQIGELVAGGATDADVRQHFVDRYGEWIRLAPSAPAAWLIPFLVVLVGTGAMAAWLLRRRAPPPPRVDLSAEERQRLREEAEALDA
jgi:cytochrome c-type biogenesis protein CcmH